MARRSAGLEPWVVVVMIILLLSSAFLGWKLYEFDSELNDLKTQLDRAKQAKVAVQNQLGAEQLKSVRNFVFFSSSMNPSEQDPQNTIGGALKLAASWGVEDKVLDSNQEAEISNLVEKELYEEAAELLAQSGYNVTTTVTRLKRALETAKGQIEGLDSNVKNLQTTSEGVESKLREEINDKQNKIDDLIAQRNELIEEKDQLENEKIDLQQEKDRIENLHASTLNKQRIIHQDEIQQLVAKNQQLNTRLVQVLEKGNVVEDLRYADPDGQVINVDSVLQLGTFYVNLGSKQRITNGMQFEVFQYTHSGEKKIKGLSEVREVYPDYCKMGVVELADRFDPIVNGDFVHNGVYDPGKIPNYYIIGALQHHTTAEMIRLIEQAGGKVMASLSTEVDQVIVGDIESDANEQDKLEEAKYLRIPTVPEKELMQFLTNYRE